MTDHIKRKFNTHLTTIEALQQSNAIFSELCEDYEEICTWLAARSSEVEMTTEEQRLARELIRELEIEIEKTISNVTFST
ncbi:MAG: hypothetical protein ACR2PH_10425 [Desulfobulbia bacterium]